MAQNIVQAIQASGSPNPHLHFIPFRFPHIPKVACAFQMRQTIGMSHIEIAQNPLAYGNISLDITGDCMPLHQEARVNRHHITKVLSLHDWAEALQVHGDILLFEPNAQSPDTASTIQGDGLATSRVGRGLMIKTADCQPVLIAHKSGKYIAAFHVGWRGNRIEFLQNGIGAFCEHYKLHAQDLMAVRGPSLGPHAAQFTNFDSEWGDDFAQWFSAREQTMDLWQLTRDQLTMAGLMPQHIYGLDLCTLSLPQAFFSYRRERLTGRQASFIWIEA